MKTEDNVNFEGILFEVIGDYQEPEEETGYKGGYVLQKIMYNGKDFTNLLQISIVDEIELMANENY